MSPFGGFRKKLKTDRRQKNKLFRNSFSLGVVAVVVVAVVRLLLSLHSAERERETRHTERETEREHSPPKLASILPKIQIR